MNSKKTWKIVGIVLVVVVLGFVFLYPNRSTAPSVSNESIEKNATISISIDDLYNKKTLSVSENETVLNVLLELSKTDAQLRLSTKEYSGLGVLVESMNGKKNGTDNKYWQYKINGIMPQIGADKYELKNGDFVEWYFGESTL